MESFILLRIERFKECRSGITAKIGAYFIDFIQKKQGVFCFCMNDGFNETPRHGTDIGPAVSADLGFIMDPSQRNTGEFSVQCTGNGTGKAGFTDTGRSHKANDRRLCFRSKDPDSKILKDTFFNFCKAVMVFIQKFCRSFQIKKVFAFFFPRQGKYPFQIVSCHGGFRHHRRHGRQMGDFFFQFLFIFIRNSAFLKLLPVFFRFCILGNFITETVMDTFYFLPEVVVTLFLFHTTPHFPIDFRFQAADLYFFIKKPTDKDQSFHDVVFFQNSLPSCGADRHLCRNKVSSVSRRVGSFQLLHLLLRNILLGIVDPFKEGFQKSPSIGFPAKFI